jgi:hypothetical protein
MEWQVVGVIVVLVGLAGSIIGPVIKLNSSITRLTVTMERLVKDVDVIKENSHDAHQRLWEKNDEQDKIINDHETRITSLERR